MPETKEIRMPHKKMLGVLMMLYGTSWIIVIIAGIVLISILGAIADYRFFFLALMWIFLIIPMIISFLYFYHGMQPLTAFNTIPHKLNFEDSGLQLIFEDENEIRRETFVSWDSYEGLRSGADYLLLLFKSPHKGWLFIPMEALQGNLQEVLNILPDRRIAIN